MHPLTILERSFQPDLSTSLFQPQLLVVPVQDSGGRGSKGGVCYVVAYRPFLREVGALTLTVALSMLPKTMKPRQGQRHTDLHSQLRQAPPVLHGHSWQPGHPCLLLSKVAPTSSCFAQHVARRLGSSVESSFCLRAQAAS